MKTTSINVAAVCVVGLVWLLSVGPSLAGNTPTPNWAAKPKTGDWNTASNWTTGSVPNSATAQAVFGSSNITKLAFSAPTTVSSMTFNKGAPAYTFAVGSFPAVELNLTGAGIVDGSNRPPTFVIGTGAPTYNSGRMQFFNSASAGDASYVVNEGELNFHDYATAGSAKILVSIGQLVFYDHATAGSAKISLSYGVIASFYGASAGQSEITIGSSSGTAKSGTAGLIFSSGSSAAYSKINNNFGGTTYFEDGYGDHSVVTNNKGGATYFYGYSNAGLSKIINNAGGQTFFIGSSATGATIYLNGGSVWFEDYASGGTAAITNAGGTFDMSEMQTDLTVGSLAGYGVFGLGGHVLTVGTNNATTTVTGSMIDGGPISAQIYWLPETGASLNKVGTGTFTLDGVNTYTGLTTVNGGGLVVGDVKSPSARIAGGAVVNSGATLSGYGTIYGNLTATGGAKIMPGGTASTMGKLTVTGNYTQTATDMLEIQLNSTQNSKLAVGGTATIAGKLLLVPSSGSYKVGKVFPVLTASALSGTFSTVGSTNGMAFKVQYSPADNPHGVDAIYASKSGGTVLSQSTINQQAVFSALALTPQGSATDGLLFDAARSGNLDAYDSLSGETQTATLTSISQGQWGFLDALAMRAGRFGGEVSPYLRGLGGAAHAQVGELTQWVGHFDDRGSAGAPNAKSELVGDATGFDLTLDQDEHFGVAMSHARGVLELVGQPQAGGIESLGLGLYAAKRLSGFVADGSVAATRVELTTARSVALSDGLARGDTYGFGAGAEVGLGYPVSLDSMSVEPRIGVGYARSHQDAYGESGADVADLTIGAADTSLLRGTASVDLRDSMALPDGKTFTTEVKLGWEHQFSDPTPEVRESFSATPAASFTAVGTRQARDALMVGTSMHCELSSGLALFGRSDLTVSAGHTDPAVSVGLQLSL